MSFFSRVGQFLVGRSSDSLASGTDEEGLLEALTEVERKFLEQTSDTIETAALLEDRRIAAHSLISFSKDHRVVVGVVALQIICKALEKDWEDEEMATDCLQLLSIICTPAAMTLKSTRNSVEFSEIFLKDESNLTSIFKILGSTNDLYLKSDILLFLVGLAENCRFRLQSIIKPTAIPLLVGLLSESKTEVLQIHLLLLLNQLAKGSLDLPQVIAFQSTFEILLDLISDAGLSSDQVIVGASLELLLTLLEGHASNQILFFESGLLTKIQYLLAVPELESDTELNQMKDESDENIILILKILSSLLDPFVSRSVPSIQNSIVSNSALFKSIFMMSFGKNVPISIRTESIRLLTKVIYRNEDAQRKLLDQEYCISLIIEASFTMEESPQELFYELTHLNDSLKYSLLAGGTTDVRLIVDGLMGVNEDKKIASAQLLGSLIEDFKAGKEAALSYQAGEDGLSLLQTLLFDFVGTPKSSWKLLVAFMKLFCVWLWECPGALQVFLSEAALLTFVIELLEHRLNDAESQVRLQGTAASLFGVCLFQSPNPNELKSLIRTKIGHEILRGKFHNLQRYTIENGAFKNLYDKTSRKVLEFCLSPPGTPNDPELFAVHLQYEQQNQALYRRIQELENLLREQERSSDQINRIAYLESCLQAKDTELRTLTATLQQNGCDTVILEENIRLKKSIEAFTAQLLAVEQENEDLLRQISELELSIQPALSLTKQTVQDNPVPTAPKSFVEAALAKASIVTSKLQNSTAVPSAAPPPPAPSAHTFDV